MSFTVNKNRLSELVAATRQVSNFGRQKRILAQAASAAGQKLQARYQRAAPDGSRWEEPDYESPTTGRTISHGRPSLRLYGSTLADSWGDAVELKNLKDGVSFIIGTKTDQVKYVHYGAIGHTIPISSKLITFYHIDSGRPMFFGGRFERPEVYHPGMKPNPFITESWRAGGNVDTAKAFAGGMGEIIQPLREFFGAPPL